MRTLVPLFALILSASLGTLAQAPAEQKLGAGVSDIGATAIAALYQAPATYVGRTIRIEGVVIAVCEEMGCWMALADAVESDRTIRFKVDHGAGIVFPISARGRRASAEGTFERIAAGDAEGREAAAEQTRAGKASDFSATYQIKATGAVIR